MRAEPLLELAIWSGMAGAIGLLLVVALADAVRLRSLPAGRGAAFILLTGASCVLMSGLPEVLFPVLDAQFVLPLKAVAGPLSGALALTYLGVWVGITNEDSLIRGVVAYGSLLLVLAAAALGVWAIGSGPASAGQVILAAAVVNGLSVVFAGVVAAHAATLGDPLARWMTLACVCLAGMVGGLYAKGLQLPSLGLGTWLLTALATVAYFLIVIALTIMRNQAQRRLRRLARGAVGEAAALELPRGAPLVASVDDALWRSIRLRRECMVAAVSLPNLYELGTAAGPDVEIRILVALAARIRRVVGFRNVVGLYHPRCFILAVSAVQDPRRSALLSDKLLRSLRDTVPLYHGTQVHLFQPVVGIGVLRVSQACADPLAAMNKAEQLALDASHLLEGVLVQAWLPAEGAEPMQPVDSADETIPA